MSTTTRIDHNVYVSAGPSLDYVGETYLRLREIAGSRPMSFGIWVREFHPGRVRTEWSCHIGGLGRRDAQTAEFLIEQMKELDREDAKAKMGPVFGEFVEDIAG